MSPEQQISSEQCRAARAWLQWSQADLAKRARIGLSTVKEFESDKREPIPNKLAAIRNAFEEAGIYLLFEGDQATGVDTRKPTQAIKGETGASG